MIDSSSQAEQPDVFREKIEDIMLKTHVVFQNVNPYIPPAFAPSQSIKMKAKFNANYRIPLVESQVPKNSRAFQHQRVETSTTAPLLLQDVSSSSNLLLTAGPSSIASSSSSSFASSSSSENKLVTMLSTTNARPTNATSSAAGAAASNALVMRREPVKVPIPKWHAPWELSAVVSGHLGWVRSIAFDPSNEWFATGSADRTIKIWDLAKCCAGVEGGLKLTLTGHISAIRGLAVSNRHPYLFSVSEDKMVNCWDLEYNKIIRHYHGHLSGVFCCSIHPTLDVLITGGRDSVARVWDIRTKHQIHVLGGHSDAVSSVLTNSINPQVITGSHDSTVKLWDLAAGKAMSTLTQHKKAVRGLTASAKELSFVSASADNIKKWQTRDGKFLKNFSGHNSVVNCLANNEDGVLVSGGDNGSINFWDYETGYNFQTSKTIAQSGSMDAEAGIFAMAFDLSGSRLITCEADKSIKIWRENDEATEDSHPIDIKGWSKKCLALKRF